MNNLPRVIQLVTSELRAWQSGSRVHMCHHGAPLSLDGFFHRNYLHICWMELMLEGLSVISPWENGCLLSLRCSLSSCNTQVFSRGTPTWTLSLTPFLSVFLCSLVTQLKNRSVGKPYLHNPPCTLPSPSVSPSLTSLVPVAAQGVVTA